MCRCVSIYNGILTCLLSFPSITCYLYRNPHGLAELEPTQRESLRQIVSIYAFDLTNRPIQLRKLVRLNRTASSMLSFAPLCAVSLDEQARQPTRTRRNSNFYVFYVKICLFLVFFPTNCTSLRLFSEKESQGLADDRDALTRKGQRLGKLIFEAVTTLCNFLCTY